MTFKTLKAQAAASRCVHSSEPVTWMTFPAPAVEGVVWDNLGKGYFKRFGGAAVATVFYVALLFLWTIPITFVASLTTLEALSEQLPFLEPVVDLSPVIKGFLEGFLPSLAM